MKQNSKINIFVPINILTNLKLSDSAIAVYCALDALAIPYDFKSICVIYHQIIYFLTGKTKQQRNRIMRNIEHGLAELVDNNIISIIDKYNKNLIIDCSNLLFDTQKEKYVTVKACEIYSILKDTQDEQCNSFKVLRYFISLMSCINKKIEVKLNNGDSKKNVIGNATIEYFANLLSLSQSSIINYNKLLEDLKLIYVCRRQHMIIDKNKNISRLSNIYGRYEDKEYIEEYAKQEREKYVSNSNICINTDVNAANKKRKLAQMYQQLIKGKGQDYTEDEIYEVYDYVIAENEKYENLYKQEGYTSYLNKIRDVSIFDKYDFIL